VKNPSVTIEVLPDYSVNISYKLPTKLTDKKVFQTADLVANLIMALGNGILDTSLRNNLSISCYKHGLPVVAKLAMEMLDEARAPRKKKRGPVIPPHQVFNEKN
jgi:hypothetical protein